MAPVRIEVRLFAGLREAAGTGSLEIELAETADAGALVEQLCELPGLGDVLRRIPVRVAVNRTYVDDDFGLSQGDEVALVPPISGGGPVRAAVTERPLDPGALLAEVGDPAAGAALLFQGTTRDVARLEYEAYGEMAEPRIAQILEECLKNARAHRGRRRTPHRHGPARRGFGSRRSLGPSPWCGVRRRPRSDRPDQGRSAGLEGGGRVRRPAPPGRRDPAPSRPRGSGPVSKRLTHIGEDGRARMVDVGAKESTGRMARARARLAVSPKTAEAIAEGSGPKGEVAGVARIAGIQAAKRTAELIPLAHPLPLTFIDVTIATDLEVGLVEVTAEARTRDRTGVEMEAMTACSVAALTIYDMVKGIERGVSIEEIALVEKLGGKSGHWLREEPASPEPD